jgi:hypothetical protein
MLSTAMICLRIERGRRSQRVRVEQRADWECEANRLPTAHERCLVPRRSDQVPCSTAVRFERITCSCSAHNFSQITHLRQVVFFGVPRSTAQYRDKFTNISQVRSTIHAYSAYATHTYLEAAMESVAVLCGTKLLGSQIAREEIMTQAICKRASQHSLNCELILGRKALRLAPRNRVRRLRRIRWRPSRTEAQDASVVHPCPLCRDCRGKGNGGKARGSSAANFSTQGRQNSRKHRQSFFVRIVRKTSWGSRNHTRKEAVNESIYGNE